MEWYDSNHFPNSIPQPRLLGCCIVASLTIVAWDFVTYVPEDVRLLKEYRIRLPTIVYLSARIVTLAAFVQALITASQFHFSFANGKPSVVGSVVHGLETSDPLSHRILLIVQRALTSLLLYLRVDALYQSNRYIQAFFGASILAILAGGVLSNLIAGISTGAFDLFIFAAIIFKLGWLPAVHPSGGSEEVLGRYKMFFKQNRERDFADRILQDSLYYVVIAILLKIPQIAYLTVRSSDYWLVSTVLLDPIFTCIISCKIFRDMKLGRSWLNGDSEKTLTVFTSVGLSDPGVSSIQGETETKGSVEV
ncbi:hypothetical protein CPB83DRAFT_910462 [Crepidotus variabilis]|uniref:DUF6533 domain-containing protein n=1 Tax=Crepidotus variabilis TaxID=179855 RepID=A0A9P6JKG4_9AGAR|nr:hypothetical protein CPB83DRAFT_910462 [Crepidotus variabilis]